MKNILLLLILVAFVSGKSQTFIGKTQDEIVKLNSSNKLTKTDKVDTLLTTITFADNKLPVTYEYSFTKNKVCVAYSISTQDKSAKENIQKDIEKRAFEKLTDKSWVEKIDGKIYGWHLQGTSDLFVFTSTQIKQ